MPQRLASALIAPPTAPAQSSLPTSPTSSSGDDPLAELMATERLEHTGWPSNFDPVAVEMEAFCAAALSSPLSFPPASTCPLPSLPGGRVTGAPSPLGFSTPPRDDASALEPASDAGPEDASSKLDALFAAPPSSVLGATPPPPPSRAHPSKDKPTLTPRCNACQAAMQSSTPVAQHAAIRLAKELAIIDADEKRVDVAASALVRRFQELLSETDIDGLSILTRIDRDAIHRAAAQAAAPSAAASAH